MWSYEDDLFLIEQKMLRVHWNRIASLLGRTKQEKEDGVCENRFRELQLRHQQNLTLGDASVSKSVGVKLLCPSHRVGFFTGRRRQSNMSVIRKRYNVSIHVGKAVNGSNAIYISSHERVGEHSNLMRAVSDCLDLLLAGDECIKTLKIVGKDSDMPDPFQLYAIKKATGAALLFSEHEGHLSIEAMGSKNTAKEAFMGLVWEIRGNSFRQKK